jgi:ubiquinone/menaquinone biosynthesis C-methylase UbiE
MDTITRFPRKTFNITIDAYSSMQEKSVSHDTVWDRLWREGNVDAAEYPLRLINIDELAGKKVLEVGCGALECSPSRFAKMDLVGVDISDVALRTYEHSSKIASLIRADAKSLPFNDESFDFVIANETLTWLGRGAFVGLNEVARVCKKGGRCVFTFKHIEVISDMAKMPDEVIENSWAIAHVDKERDAIVVSEKIVKEAMDRIGLIPLRFMVLTESMIWKLCEPFNMTAQSAPQGKKEGIFVDAVKT